MSSKISRCLTAAGISKIIWIDDYFASPNRNDLEESILKTLSTMKLRGETTCNMGAFGTLDLNKSKDQIDENAVEICQSLNEIQLQEILTDLGATMLETEVPLQPDLSPDEFLQLQHDLGANLQKFSLSTWTSGGVTQFENAGEDTLFLVDKEFSREDSSYDGTLLLKHLVEKSTALCVLLTHTCSARDQEARRIEFAASIGLPAQSFCVISKAQNLEATVDERFATAIRTVVMHKYNGLIANAISETIQESAKKVAAELSKQSASVLDQALFKNSAEEGVMEYDVVMRIFDVWQRYELNRALKEPSIQRDLRSARKYRKETSGLGLRHEEEDISFFLEWRQREMFLDGEGLNALHVPLSCGDVFKCVSGKLYLLLAQPCDLMVRENGKRRAEVGLMVLLSESTGCDMAVDSEAVGPVYRFFELQGVFGLGRKWVADFQTLFFADLFVLDLAVFNLDGSVRLMRNHPEPAIVLTDGWTKRLKKAKELVFPDATSVVSRQIGIGKHAEEITADHSEGLSYPLARIGRLESNLTTAILAAWATFQTRAVFDHDFVKQKQLPVVHPIVPTVGTSQVATHEAPLRADANQANSCGSSQPNNCTDS